MEKVSEVATGVGGSTGDLVGQSELGGAVVRAIRCARRYRFLELGGSANGS